MNWQLFWHKTLGRPYRLQTTIHGDRSLPVIVFLHGIAASSEDWRFITPLISDRYCCITIDLLGFATSPKPQWADYTMETHLQAIDRTIRGLRLKQPFILVGHSMGSLLAARYATQHPKQVSRLLLLSPPVYPPLDSIDKKIALKRTDWLMKLYKFLRTHPRMTPANFKRLSLIIPLPKSITRYPETWVPFFRSLEHCIEQQTILQDITTVQAPVDVFYGTLDTVVIGSNVQQLQQLHDVQLHSFRGNHSISRTYAKAVTAIL